MKAIFSHMLYAPEMHVRNYVCAYLAFKLIGVHILSRVIRAYVKHPRGAHEEIKNRAWLANTELFGVHILSVLLQAFKQHASF